jgi:hypothetical protein
MSANINPIVNGEPGISVRTKLNSLVDKAQATSGSLNTLTDRFNTTSGSLTAASASFSTRVTNNTSDITALSSSYRAASASFSSSISTNTIAIGNLNAASASYFATSASFNTVQASVTALNVYTGSNNTAVTNLSSSLAQLDIEFETFTESEYPADLATIDFRINEITASISSSGTGSLTEDLAQLSSSFETFSGSYNSGSFSGSFAGNGSGLTGVPSASFATTASFLQHNNNDFEVHVSQENGVDAVGRGSLLYPYKTISYAITQLGNASGRRIIIHRGEYTENVNISALTNTSIVGFEAGNGSLVSIIGQVSVNTAGTASTRISNLRCDTLLHQGTGALFLENVSVVLEAIFNSNYVEVINCRLEPGSLNIEVESGLAIFHQSIIRRLFVRGTGTAYVKDCIGVTQATAEAGTLAIINTQVTAAVANQPAINTSAGSVLNLVNTQISTAAGAPARIAVGGLLAYDDVLFDKANSTLGTQVPLTARFQNIDTNLVQVTGSVLISGSLVANSITVASGSIPSASFATTASFAVSASQAVSASFVVSSSQAVSASFATSASFAVSSSRAVSSSFATTASFLDGDTTIYFSANKSAQQSIPFVTATTVVNWDTPNVNTLPSAWNNTTGLFTVPRAGIYEVFAQIMFASVSAAVGNEIALQIMRNSSAFGTAQYFSENSTNTLKPTVNSSVIMSCAAGDTISVQVFQGLTGGAVNTHPARNMFTIKELPLRINRV